ncbi:MAG TPA: DoxX family protein [Bacteroidetes bacterium]|nr:DoxX family protein [Bacteroidota bacterium]
MKNVSRYIAGMVFIFSGLVKAIDPMGSMYKFIDYFTAFNLDALEPLAYILGVILCTAEFITGFAVLTGIRTRLAAWGMLVFMLGFTPLTLYLAIANPVADCGCFGDAIHLTNWQTFYKNIIISVFAVIVFVNRNNYKTVSTPLYEWLAISIITAAFVLFTTYSYRHLPVIDFRPYHTGANIPEKMTIPDGAPIDEYETTLIYEKDGKQKEFTLENYPSDDTTWTFVDSRSRLVKKGYEPPIHDFSMITPDGQDLTDIILNDEGFSFLMLSIKFSEADADLIDRGIESGLACQDAGISFYILTSSTPSFIDDYEGLPNIFYVDETTMKTIIRSNPGFMVIREGTITKKWAGRDLPQKNKLDEIILNSFPVKSKNRTVILLSIMAGILLFSYITNFILRKLKKNKQIL